MTEKTAYTLLGLLVVIIAGGVFFAISSKEDTNETNTMLTLTSSVFEHNRSIPSQYTCDGENISPELLIEGVPEGTESLVLLVDDPDIPQVVKDERGIEKFDHWVLYSIPPETAVIPEGESVGSEGLNSAGDTGYRGPCPPTEHEPTEHRYIFRLYALDTAITFIKVPTLDEVASAIEDHILESTELIGLYDRKK